MSNTTQSKRKFSFQSLGIRIFFLSFILLVLPLLFHNLLMYKEDYQEKKENLFLSLRIIGDNKAYDVQQYIESEQKFLNWISKEPITKELLERAQAEEVLSKISFISEDHNDLSFSKNLQSLRSIRNQYSENRAFLLEIDDQKNLIIPIPVKRNNSLEGYLLSETPITDVKNSLFQQFSFPYPLTVRFYANKNDPYPEDEGVEPFLVNRDDKIYFAKRVPFEGTNFSLMFYVLESDIQELSVAKVILSIVQLLIFFFLIGGIAVFFLTARMSRPIKHLLDVMDKVANQKLSARYQKDKMGFEINLLGSHFNQMIDSLIHYQDEVETIHIKNEILRKELEIGRDIQQSLFPKKLPSIQNLDIATYCKQAKEVGGDFYDLFIIDNRLIFCIADVSGKGISACLYSLGVRSLIRSAFSQEDDIKKALQTVNHLFYEDVGDIGVFTTLWIGSLNLKTNELTYSSLGHHPALLKKADKLIELSTKSNALGPFKDVFIEIDNIVLEKGDLLFLYTDGVIDRQNLDQEFFGYENIKTFLHSEETPVSHQLIDNFIQTLDTFAKTEPLYDDLTLASIFIK